jgi:hypothetical protein
MWWWLQPRARSGAEIVRAGCDVQQTSTESSSISGCLALPFHFQKRKKEEEENLAGA